MRSEVNTKVWLWLSQWLLELGVIVQLCIATMAHIMYRLKSVSEACCFAMMWDFAVVKASSSLSHNILRQ